MLSTLRLTSIFVLLLKKIMEKRNSNFESCSTEDTK